MSLAAKIQLTIDEVTGKNVSKVKKKINEIALVPQPKRKKFQKFVLKIRIDIF